MAQGPLPGEAAAEEGAVGTLALAWTIADLWLGKYRTIVSLSLVYCLGHLVLALDSTRTGLFWGLTLVAIGAGGIKPCVASHVGDQFGRSNAHLVSRIYYWFYFSINFGSMFATLFTPFRLSRTGGDTWHFLFAPAGLASQRPWGLARVEWRGWGGWVVAPPSHHPGGAVAAWVRDLDTRLPELPPAIAERLEQVGPAEPLSQLVYAQARV